MKIIKVYIYFSGLKKKKKNYKRGRRVTEIVEKMCGKNYKNYWFDSSCTWGDSSNKILLAWCR